MGILKIHGGIAYEEKIPLKRLGKKDFEYITGCGADNSSPAGYGKRDVYKRQKSYSKKGDAVVEMNYKAIDAGVDAVHKVEEMCIRDRFRVTVRQ